MMQVSDNDICFVKTTKFKTIAFAFKFTDFFNINKRLTQIICSQLFSEKCDKYPTKELMTIACDSLYSPGLALDRNSFSNYDTFGVYFHFVNPKYTDLSIEDYFIFMQDVLNSKQFSEVDFQEAKLRAIESFERKSEKQLFKAMLENLRIYQQFQDYSMYQLDLKQELLRFSYQDFMARYPTLLCNSNCKVIVVGDVEEDKVKNFVMSLNFSTKQLNINSPLKLLPKIDPIEIDNQSTQSVAILNFNCPIKFASADYYKWIFSLVCLGKGTSSKLFKEVREKNSLCYNIGIGEFKHEGVFYIYSLIDAKNFPKLKQLSFKQIEDLSNGLISDEDFNRCKKVVIQSILSEDDSIQDLVERSFHHLIFQLNIDKNDLIGLYQSFTKQDIASVMKKAEFTFSLLLKGNKHETI